MKDKKLFVTIVSMFTIISFIIGISYAYFVPIIIGNDTASNHNQTTGTLQLTYNGTNVLSMPNAQPGDTTSATFTVKNTGNLPVDSYEIYFSKLINTFINNEVVYTLTCLSSDTNPCLNKEQSPVPTTEELSITQGGIDPGTTHTYTLTVTFINKDEPQNYNQGKALKFTMTINKLEEIPPSTLIARQAYNSTELFWEHRENITEVTFEDAINIPNGVTSWDVSESQDGKIMAYIIDDGLGTNTYHLYIQSNREIYANQNMAHWFQFEDLTGFGSKLTKINNLSLLNTSNVVKMSGMFAGCTSLVNLDLSNFDTSNVTNMSGIFRSCSNLVNLDLSNFDTSNVTNMFAMFNCFRSQINLDLSSFDTSKVTNISLMFWGCNFLTDLNIRNMTFTSVTSYNSMFTGIPNGINIIVKDNASQTYINNRLSEVGKTGNVTIYVP